MRIFELPRYVFGAGAVVAILAGCNGAASVTPAQVYNLAQNSSQSSRSTNLVGIAARSHRETIDGAGGHSSAPSCSNHQIGGYVLVSESGNATGPYKGTFTDSAGFFAYCGQTRNTQVNGAFAITAGPDTINGSFSGSGTGSCGNHAWGETCYFVSSQVTYSASLTRGGKVRKQFNGNASVKIGGVVSSLYMDLTLTGM